MLSVSLSQLAFGQADAGSVHHWTPETIALPPGFAPGFPPGIEELRFPPGWRDRESEHFWSYAIVMGLDEAAPTGERLEKLTEMYYSGLMGAFGIGREPGALPNTVDVHLEQGAAGIFEGSMRLVDGFATREPITVNLKIRARARSEYASTLEFRVSPQPDTHGIWGKLQRAIDEMVVLQRIQNLAHFPHGEWRMTPASRRQQRDVWAWGPSRRALTSVTTNREGTSESVFGSFRVIYDNPQRERLSVLALSGPELIQKGTVEALDGGSLRFEMELFYDQDEIEWAPEPTRRIVSEWTFEDASSYTNSWVEDQGRPVDPGMTAWRYRRHNGVTHPPASAGEPPEQVGHLGALLPLLESEWADDATRTHFSWIPYNEAILMRTSDKRSGAIITEGVFYPHPHTKVIHTLAVHGSGAVDEGTASRGGDAILIRSTRSERSGTTEIEQRLKVEADGSLRVTTWTVGGDERALLAESVQRPATE